MLGLLNTRWLSSGIFHSLMAAAATAAARQSVYIPGGSPQGSSIDLGTYSSSSSTTVRAQNEHQVALLRDLP
jgi:hypothetical protein